MDHRTLLSGLRGPGRGPTDDFIFATLRAAEDGANIAALCAARGVTVPTYCLWKAKYGALTLADLRRQRRQEAVRARLQGAGVAAALAATLGAGLWLITGASDAEQTGAGMSREAAEPVISPEMAAPTPTAAESGTATTAADTAFTVAAAEALRARAPSRGQAPGARVQPSTAESYAVQVAAFPEPQQARRMVEQLALAGHTAHVLPATLSSNVEVFRVRVGPFASRQAAEQTLGQLEREGYQGPWIAR
jgi:cell division septation protein DedD